MSQILNLQITDQTYAALENQAATSGVSVSQLATAALERQFRNGTVLSEEQKHVASARFERHFGEIAIGSGADNESIDADLARAYAADHEGN